MPNEYQLALAKDGQSRVASIESAEVPIPTEISVRFHHFDNWLFLVEQWYGLEFPDLLDLKRGKKTAGDLQISRPKPWLMAQNPENIEEIREFCHQAAEMAVQSLLDEYQKMLIFKKCVEYLIAIKAELTSQTMLPDLNDLISTIQQLFSLTSYRYDSRHFGVLSSSEANSLWRDIPEPRLYSFYRALADRNIREVAEWQNDPEWGDLSHKDDREMADDLVQRTIDFKSKLVLIEEIFLRTPNPELLSHFLGKVSFFFDTETRPLLEERELFDSLTSAPAFFSAIQNFRNVVDNKIIYYQDILGPNPAADQPLTQATLNQRYIMYSKFMRTAMEDPEKQILFTLEPDLICQSCRGGETETGYHCVVRRYDDPDQTIETYDHFVRDAMVAFFESDQVTPELRSKVVIERTPDGRPTTIRMPISAYFDLDLMNALNNETRAMTRTKSL